MIINYCNCYWRYYLTHPHIFIYHLYRDIKAIIHRGLYGWDKSDTWSVYDYMLTIITPMLDKLRDDCHGCNNKYWDKKEKNGNECHLWKEELKELSDGLKKVKEFDYSPLTKQRDKLFKKHWKKLGEIFFLLWD